MLQFCRFLTFFSSDEDDVQPNIVVLKMQKPDSIGNGEFDDRIVREGLTHGNNDGTWEGKGLQKATHDSEIKGHKGKKVADKLATTGKARDQTLRSFATSRNVYFKDIIDFAPATSNSFFKNDGFHRLKMDSIPVSGYTTFQQRDFSLLYFHFSKQLFKVKAQADQLSVQSTMTWQGSLSKGPFPFYEEIMIPLIKMLVMSSKETYCDDYVPVALTNTNIPLTVSP